MGLRGAARGQGRPLAAGCGGHVHSGHGRIGLKVISGSAFVRLARTHRREPGRRRKALAAIAIATLALVGLSAFHIQQAREEPLGAIVVLGGGIQRELAAARIARQIPYIPIIVSSGSPGHCTRHYFVDLHGIPPERLVMDFRAGDTLTNFTATLPELRARGVQRVLLVTSQGHLTRARTLAWIVWGSHGIAFDIAAIAGEVEGESFLKTTLDAVRATGWLLIGDPVVQSAYKPDTVLEDAAAAGSIPCEPATGPAMTAPR
jgi:uncharacterized SAM-binding protein YcdF (DUF218 family)